jgi:hypothetical protein
MSLYNQIISEYPELTSEDFVPETGSINLRDDSDGVGVYISKWEYSKPIPKGLTVGKSTK